MTREPTTPPSAAVLPPKAEATGGNAPTPRCPPPSVPLRLAAAYPIGLALEERPQWENIELEGISGDADCELNKMQQDTSQVAPMVATTPSVDCGDHRPDSRRLLLTLLLLSQ